jgi:hypothetical protein
LTERLYTFNAVFTKNLGGEPDRTVTAHISLLDAQMSAIFQTTENIRFFDYLYEFDGVPHMLDSSTRWTATGTQRPSFATAAM